jgi:hypothetical protein
MTLRKLTLTLSLACLAALPLAAPARSCTLWAVAGQAAGGGALIAKNRDWVPDHVQVFKVI